MSSSVAPTLRHENLNIPLSQYFELKKAPFPQMLAPKDMLMLPPSQGCRTNDRICFPE